MNTIVKFLSDMELSAGAALFAALILLFGVLAIVCWIADIIQKWRDKRHPKPKKKPLSFNDSRFRR